MWNPFSSSAKPRTVPIFLSLSLGSLFVPPNFLSALANVCASIESIQFITVNIPIHTPLPKICAQLLHKKVAPGNQQNKLWCVTFTWNGKKIQTGARWIMSWADGIFDEWFYGALCNVIHLARCWWKIAKFVWRQCNNLLYYKLWILRWIMCYKEPNIFQTKGGQVWNIEIYYLFCFYLYNWY